MRQPADGAGLLLAAGLSRRFGQEDKLLAAYRDRPLVVHAAGTLASIGLGRLIAIASSTRVAALLPPLGFGIVMNPAPEAGLGHSLALAAKALRDEPWALVTLGDMPAVPPNHLMNLVATDAPIAASAADGIAMPPARFDAALFGTLRTLDGDQGARSLLRQARLLDLPATLLHDVDRRYDLLR